VNVRLDHQVTSLEVQGKIRCTESACRIDALRQLRPAAHQRIAHCITAPSHEQDNGAGTDSQEGGNRLQQEFGYVPIISAEVADDLLSAACKTLTDNSHAIRIVNGRDTTGHR